MRFVAPVVQGDQVAPVALEFVVQEHAVVCLAADAVGVLGDDQRDSALLHEVAHPIQTGPFEVRSRMPLVLHDFQELVLVLGTPGAQCLLLVGDGIARAGLLGRGDPAVGDGYHHGRHLFRLSPLVDPLGLPLLLLTAFALPCALAPRGPVLARP